jgi:hypothetical protein
MADRMLFISWGPPVPGREEHSLEVFNEAVGLYGRMKQEGRIEGFDVAVLGPNTLLDGFMTLTGSAEQIAAVRESDEYLRVMIDAGLCVQGLSACEGYTSAGVARVMGLYGEAVAKVPQTA